VPARVAWAVDLLEVRPDDRILEFGCGPGVAVALVCERLTEGHITAIDRSPTAVDRARSRNRRQVAAGRAEIAQVELGRFTAEPGTFDKAFGVNVNVFWTTDAAAECAVLARVLGPGGVLRLVYGGVTAGRGPLDVAPRIEANLARHGFTTEVLQNAAASAVCLSAVLG
jgi:SAM-dependent methyltransferase